MSGFLVLNLIKTGVLMQSKTFLITLIVALLFLGTTFAQCPGGGEFKICVENQTSNKFDLFVESTGYSWGYINSEITLVSSYQRDVTVTNGNYRFDAPKSKNNNIDTIPWGRFKIKIISYDSFNTPNFVRSFYLDLRDENWSQGITYSDYQRDTWLMIDQTSGNERIYLLGFDSEGGEITRTIADYDTNTTINIWTFMGIATSNTTNFKVPITLFNKIENTNTSFGYLEANGRQVRSGNEETFKYNVQQSVAQGTLDTTTNVRNYSFKWSNSNYITPQAGQNIYCSLFNFSTVIDVYDKSITRNFRPVYPLTIKNSLDELGGISTDIVYFKDPTTTNSYEQKSASGSGFYKDNAFDSLSIIVENNPEQKYGAKAKQQIIYNGKTYNYLEGDFNTTGTEFLVTAPTTKVAYYKGHLLSGVTTGFSSNSQRKIVRTDDGHLHIVYESMASVWYTRSTDGGSTWLPEQRVNPACTNAKGVSIAHSDDGLNYVYIVYQINSDVFPSIDKGIILAQYYYGAHQWSRTVYNLSTYDYDTKPVVAAQNNVAYVVFKPTSTSQLRAAKVSSSGVVYSSFALSNTTSGSVNPSLAAAVQNFYLAYQNNSTEIRYSKFSADGTINKYAVVSSGSGFTNNILPSLSTHAGDPVISWSGYNSSIPTIVIRRKTGNTWSTFKQCANGTAAYPSNNNSRGSGSDGSIIAWMNMYNQTQYIKFVNGAYSTVRNLSYSGQEIQIGNGYEFDQLKAVTYYRAGSAPYGINPLQYNFNTMQKTTDGNEFNYARLAVIGKDNAEIVYGLGDIKLNNERILFTRLNDMVQINNAQDLSSAMRTENFVLQNDSKLEFSDCAYIINRDSVDLSPSDILPHIELVNLTTGLASKVKDISFSVKDTIDEKTYYLLNCGHLPEGTYYLRVNLDTKEQYQYSLSDCIYEENNSLSKREYKEITLADDLIPKVYALEQNYPNPFNPSTTIRYQLTKDGLVTLKIYDIIGSEIATLVNEEKIAGKYEINFDASSLASGVYIYRIVIHSDKLQAGDPSASSGQVFVSSKKMILLK
jgi:hypothetical protein